MREFYGDTILDCSSRAKLANGRFSPGVNKRKYTGIIPCNNPNCFFNSSTESGKTHSHEEWSQSYPGHPISSVVSRYRIPMPTQTPILMNQQTPSTGSATFYLQVVIKRLQSALHKAVESQYVISTSSRYESHCPVLTFWLHCKRQEKSRPVLEKN